MSFIVKSIYFILVVVETVLIMRFVLDIVGVENSSWLGENIKNLSDIFIYPWKDFIDMNWNIGKTFINVDALFSLVMYLVFGFGVSETLKLISQKE